MSEWRAVVRGKVQGVGFRRYVQREADRLGLAGWVRNEPDGSVALGASGEAVSLAALQRAVRRGPPWARVDDVVDLEADGSAVQRPFAVLRDRTTGNPPRAAHDER